MRLNFYNNFFNINLTLKVNSRPSKFNIAGPVNWGLCPSQLVHDHRLVVVVVLVVQLAAHHNVVVGGGGALLIGHPKDGVEDHGVGVSERMGFGASLARVGDHAGELHNGHFLSFDYVYIIALI